MDIIIILFLTFGWIFKIKGLVITALVLAALFGILQFLTVGVKSPAPEKQGKIKLSILTYFVLLALSIIKLCIW